MMRVDPQFRVEVRSAARRWLSTAIGLFGSLPRNEYRSIVAKVVATIASQSVSEDRVYSMSLGAFPTVVKSVLGSLSGRNDTGISSCPEPSPIDIAPWEHEELDPVDFEWYFDVPTDRRILSYIRSYFPSGARSMVALGTPTVAAMAAYVVPEVTLVDISPRFWSDLAPKWLDVSKVERVRHDLDEKVYAGMSDADVVVMDPPWYIENYRAWLKSAVAVCRDGGLIAVALPQMLTNRRSLPEREEILSLLKAIGTVSMKEDALTYVTPTFEAAVLEANGLAFLRRWRRADLALVQVRERSLPYEFQQFGGSEWSYREVCGQVVRTWSEIPREGKLPLIGPTDANRGYRLTAVGRNYICSSNANLITSRGRAASVRCWGALPRILDLAQAGHSLDSAVIGGLPHGPVPERQSLIHTLRTIFGR